MRTPSVIPFVVASHLVVTAAACGGTPGYVPTTAPAENPVDVRQFAAQPRYTSFYREGDPYPVVSLAAATELGVGANMALAAVVRQRLPEAETRVDGLAVRITVPLADAAADPRATLDRVARAVGTSSVTPAEVAVARASWTVRPNLEAPQRSAFAHCAGQGPSEREAEPDGAAVRAWLVSGFDLSRLSLAYVGPAAMGEAVAAALPTTRGWSVGHPSPPSLPWSSGSSHRAHVGATAELRVGIHHADAVAGVMAARELSRTHSPLAHHLQLLDPPWRITTVGATAHRLGGCLHVVVTPVAPHLTPDVRAAAAALAATRRALGSALTPRPDSAAIMRASLIADDVHRAAERAAWWALTEPVDRSAAPSRPTVVSTWTSVAEPATDVPAAETAPRDEHIDAAYARAVRTAAMPADAPRDEVIRVTTGQGAFWMLVAQPCAVGDETVDDAGQTALAAAALAAAADDARHDDTTAVVRPWVTTRGVGLLAHAVPAVDEPPGALAARVGDTLGRWLTALPHDPAAVRRARHAVTSLLDDGRARLLAAAAARRFSGRTSTWMPWGARASVVEADVPSLMARWRTVLRRGAWRVAVAANADAAQSRIGIDAFRRWLPATHASPDGEACVADAGLDPNAAGGGGAPPPPPPPAGAPPRGGPGGPVRPGRRRGAG
ncbi:MAG: hypothetical protein AAGN82_03775, partial [Myxococcota bacterium]